MNEQGLYSPGGLKPRFTKEGKTWHRNDHVDAHLRQFFDDRSRCANPKGPGWLKPETSLYENCVVIEYDLVPSKKESVLSRVVKVKAKDRKRTGETW